ncbi:ATP-grasp domain-containing protein, partial [Candidatus Daviesbacteria bacterium]|nr:ATP-grasp domain-containing protein [Candidatus Daviesbacteria bacterium]
DKYLRGATEVSKEHPVVISKFIDNAKEIEIDGVAKDGRLIIYAISEHVENAGVHSGDATIVLPPQRLYLETVRQIKLATKKIVKALNINGPFNIQFLAKDNNVKVIELNLRASRSFPFVSKVTGYNFVEIATKVMLGEEIKEDFKTLDLDYVSVKAAQFSFNRIKGADPTLKVEMASTGEVACFGEDLEEAFLKAFLATGGKLPQKSIYITIGGEENKLHFLGSAKKLSDLGLRIYATEKTSKLLSQNGIKNTLVYKISESKNPSVLDLMEEGKIDFVINIVGPQDIKGPPASLPAGKAGLAGDRDGFIMRRTCVEYGIPLITNLQSAIVFAESMASKRMEDLEIKSWDEYLN